MNIKLNKLALAIGAMTIAGASFAAVETANLATSATVQNACAIGVGAATTGTISLDVNDGLGTVNATPTSFNSGESINIVCTIGATAAITAGLGANAAGSVRNMLSGTDKLAYELYTTADLATVLDTTTGSIPYTGTGATTTNTVIYGKITGAQLAAAPKGSYTDTVGLTITYTP